MSFDYKLAQRCLHQLDLIPLELDFSNRMELRIPYFVASRSDFVLYANGEKVDPNFGQFQYSLEQDDLAVGDGYLKVRFKYPIISDESYFSCQMVTIAPACPRCAGEEIEADIRPNGQGGWVEIRNEDKLIQEVTRHEVVRRSSMFFHPEYGSNLADLIGTVQTNGLPARIGQEVRNALERLQRLQKQQMVYQQLSAGEYLQAITSVQSFRDSIEPTLIIVETFIRSLSGKGLQVSQEFANIDLLARLSRS